MSRPILAVCLLLGVGVAGCGSGEKTVTVDRTVTAPPATGATSTPTVPQRTPPPNAAPTKIVHRRIFQTPSHNIGCGIYGSARCDIDKRNWSPPPHPSNCDVDFGQGLQVGPSAAASFVCAGDTARDLRSPVLAYGTGSRIGHFLCISRTSGVTCTNRATGHGFLISVERYRLF
jgi:uncharacterized protein DUF6636